MQLIKMFSAFFVMLTMSTLIQAQSGAAEKSIAPVIIDVRTLAEYQSGHINNALLIPHGEVHALISKHVPNKNTPIILYCKSGGRATVAKNTLQLMGYKQVENAGGYVDLKKLLESQ